MKTKKQTKKQTEIKAKKQTEIVSQGILNEPFSVAGNARINRKC